MYYGQFNPPVDKLISDYFDDEYKGGCIDIGASDGISGNNTKHFEEKGWYCLCIEPNQNFNLKIKRPNTLNYAISDKNEDNIPFNVVSYNGQEISTSSLRIDDRLIEEESKIGNNNPVITQTYVNTRTLNFIIENHYKFDSVDFISIDTEGTELDILKGFDIQKYKPKLIVIENNFKDPDIEEYLKGFNYIKHQNSYVNDFYIPKPVSKLYFYNLGNKGDIHLNREYVKDIIRKTNFDEYHFLSKNPNTILDIPELKQGYLNEYCLGRGDLTLNHTYLNLNNEDIYINMTFFGDYKSFNEIMTHIYYQLNISFEDVSFYYPQIDYKYYQIDNANNFLKNYINNFKVLICNNKTLSGQSENSDLNDIVSNLSDDFQNVIFILTDDSNRLEKKNVFYTSDINKNPNDINEISYISTFCDVIIGRSSGPYVYTLVKENLMNPFKSFIFICREFFQGIYYLESSCEKTWINKKHNMHGIMKESIHNKSEIYNHISIYKSDVNKIFIKPLHQIDENITIHFFDDVHLEPYNKSNNLPSNPIYIFSSTINNNTYWITPYNEYTIDKTLKLKIYFKGKIYMKIL